MSSSEKVVSAFEKIGARATIQPMTRQLFQRHGTPFVIDVRRRGDGETFEILKTRNVRLRVLDSMARHHHLLLAASLGSDEDRFLCGHDEQHWFVAGLREQTTAANVRAAMDSLKPAFVKILEGRKTGRHRRKTDVYIRQGEWFFVPCPHASVDADRIQRRRPLIRGSGNKPHICEFMYFDGEREYECDRYPKLAFFESEYRKIVKSRRKAKQWGWRQLPYHPDIYVRGSVSHPDHAIIYLECWHRVKLNRENQSKSLRRKRVLTTIRYRD